MLSRQALTHRSKTEATNSFCLPFTSLNETGGSPADTTVRFGNAASSDIEARLIIRSWLNKFKVRTHKMEEANDVAVRAQEVFASLQDKKVMKKLKLCELRQCC